MSPKVNPLSNAALICFRRCSNQLFMVQRRGCKVTCNKPSSVDAHDSSSGTNIQNVVCGYNHVSQRIQELFISFLSNYCLKNLGRQKAICSPYRWSWTCATGRRGNYGYSPTTPGIRLPLGDRTRRLSLSWGFRMYTVQIRRCLEKTGVQPITTTMSHT